MEIKIERDYLAIDGIPRFIYGGDLNYALVRRRHWRDRIRKMKAAGMNTVTFYCPWLYHEPVEGQWNWSDNTDLAGFIDLISEEGMWAIARLGPFVHGEMRNGGLPQWLVDKLGDRVRSNDTEYLKFTQKWYENLIRIIKPRLITGDGPIILLQLENELGSAGSKGDDIHRGTEDATERTKHILFYDNLIRQAGIDVPLIDINKPYPGKEDNPLLVDTGGGYPVSCFCSDGELGPLSFDECHDRKRPRISIETMAGMFVRYYDWPPYKHTNGFQGPIVLPEVVEAFAYRHLATGWSGINFFVVNDGEYPDAGAERMLPQRIYGYQAPLSVCGIPRQSYQVVKRLGWFLRAFEQEIIQSRPHETWATAVSCGKSHPGVHLAGGDFFENYHKPTENTADYTGHVKPVESMGRVTKGLNLSESNFLVMFNTRSYGTQWLRDIRIESNPRGIPCEVFHAYPKRVQLELAPQENRIIPFYVRLAPHHFLEYSTAQLLDRRPFGNGTQVILFARSDETTETRLVLPDTCHVRSMRGALVTWESPNTVSLLAIPGSAMDITCLDSPTPIRFVVMEKARAGEVWDVLSPFGSLVVSSSLVFLRTRTDGKHTKALVQTAGQDFHLYLFSPVKTTVRGPFASFQDEYDAEFGLYKASGTIGAAPPRIAFSRRRQDSNYIWETVVTPDILNDLEDVCLQVEYDGTLAHAYWDETLISDHAFGKFYPWEIGLRNRVRKPGTLRLVFQNCHQAEVKIKPVRQFEITFEWVNHSRPTEN